MKSVYNVFNNTLGDFFFTFIFSILWAPKCDVVDTEISDYLTWTTFKLSDKIGVGGGGGDCAFKSLNLIIYCTA